MEGIRGRNIVSFIITIFLILNLFSLSITVKAQEGNLEIVVDSTSKQVFPGENAVFYWTAYNNDTITTYDLTVTSSPHSEFSESSFTLEPGESHTVNQTAITSINDENNTQYIYSVTWTGIWYQLLTSGSIPPIQTDVVVTVITDGEGQIGGGDNTTGNGSNGGGDNNTGEEGDTNQNGDKGNETTPGFASIYLVVAIFITLILLKKGHNK